MLKLLINKIHNKIPYEECYFDLEPLYERDNIITEKLLIFIFTSLFLDKNISELITIIYNKEPRLQKNTITILICDIFSGEMEIYPSELKRANIPYPLYLYMTTFYYKSYNITEDRVIGLWNNIKNIYVTNIKSIIIYEKIQHFLNKKCNYRKKIKLKIKLSNHFRYFDSRYDRLCQTSDILLHILHIIFNSDISLIIYKYIIYDKIIDFSFNIKKSISKLFNVIGTHTTNFIHDKYFEHLFFTRNINKLCKYNDISIII